MSLILSGTDGISDVDGSASTPALRGTDANTGIFFPAADTIAFSEGGVESMRIDSAGNVGIGTASPVEKLTVAGSISTNIDLVLKQGTTDRGYIFGTSSGLFYRATSGLPHVFQNVGTELMRITSTGNLGIGTASPKSVGNYTFVTTNATTGSGYSTQVNGTEASNFYANTSATVVQEVRALPLVFETTATERMRITSGGFVGIGTNSPAYPLHVSGASDCVLFLTATNSNASGQYVANGNGAGSYPAYNLYQSGVNYWSVMMRADTNLYFQRQGGSGNTILTDGTFKTPSTISVGNATPSTSGAGITFPATQSASSDANTLDDYEEGTWSPTDASGAGLTFSVLGAFYVKIGRLVIAQVELTFPSTGSGATATIGGLPFATSSTSVYRASTGGGYNNKNLNYAVYSGNNSTSLGFYNTSGNGIPNSSCSGGLFTFTHIYQV